MRNTLGTSGAILRRTVASQDDLDALETLILASVEATATSLRQILETDSAVSAFARLKFLECGCDPLDVDRSLNLVEQLNQTFTYLASVAGARWLVAHHPECLPLNLNLGTSAGYDIESCNGEYVAETFAVTHPGSNDKLRKDIARLEAASALHRYVFYLSPVEGPAVSSVGVTVVRLNHPAVSNLRASA